MEKTKGSRGRLLIRLLNELIEQARAAAPVLGWGYAFLLFLLTGAVIASVRLDLDISEFLSDPAVLSNSHPLRGVLSTVGNLIWCAAGAICLFVSLFSYRLKDARSGLFFLLAGGFTIVLCLDDLFMIHEYLLEAHLGISQNALFAVYGLFLAFFLVRYRAMIARTRYGVLLLACFFLGLSLVTDILIHPDTLIGKLLEDGAKLFGIGTWLVYFTGAGLDRILTLRRQPSEDAS